MSATALPLERKATNSQWAAQRLLTIRHGREGHVFLEYFDLRDHCIMTPRKTVDVPFFIGQKFDDVKALIPFREDCHFHVVVSVGFPGEVVPIVVIEMIVYVLMPLTPHTASLAFNSHVNREQSYRVIITAYI